MPEKAYGREHQVTRAKMLRALPSLPVDKASPLGQLCPRCGLVMMAWQPLDLGHSSHEAKVWGLPGDRLEHAWCNRSAGPSKTMHPGVGYEASREW